MKEALPRVVLANSQSIPAISPGSQLTTAKPRDGPDSSSFKKKKKTRTQTEEGHNIVRRMVAGKESKLKKKRGGNGKEDSWQWRKAEVSGSLPARSGSSSRF